MRLLTPLRDWWERRHDALTCRRVVELLTDYLEGALPADVRDDVDAHVGDCAACAAYLEQLRLTIDVLGRLEPPPIEPAARDQLIALYRAVGHRRPTT